MYSSQSVSLIVAAVVLALLASIAVALRFKVRGMVKTGRGPDDWIILGALLTQYVSSAVTMYGAIAGGEGDDLVDLIRHPKRGERLARIMFATTMIFAMTIALIKVSTLVFYRRLFTVGRFRLACSVMFFLTGGWFLAAILGQMFSSTPISDSWTSLEHRTGHSVISIPDFQLSLAAINLALDFTIVCMPLFVISKLHMDRKRKWAVGGIFMLGAFCCVASIIRLYWFVRLKHAPKDPNTHYTRLVTYNTLWSLTECCTSIIAACLPTFSPLFRNNPKLDSVIRSIFSILALKSLRSKGNSSDSHRDAERGGNEGRRASGDTWRKFNFDSNDQRWILKADGHIFEDDSKLLSNAHARAFHLQLDLPSQDAVV